MQMQAEREQRIRQDVSHIKRTFFCEVNIFADDAVNALFQEQNSPHPAGMQRGLCSRPLMCMDWQAAMPGAGVSQAVQLSCRAGSPPQFL